MAINYSPIPTQSEAQTLYNSTVAAGKEARMNYAISYLAGSNDYSNEFSGV